MKHPEGKKTKTWKIHRFLSTKHSPSWRHSTQLRARTEAGAYLLHISPDYIWQITPLKSNLFPGSCIWPLPTRARLCMWQHKLTLCMPEVAQTEPLSAPGLNSSLVFSLWRLWEVRRRETCLLCIFEGGLSYKRRLGQLSRMKAKKDMVILHKKVERSGTGGQTKLSMKRLVYAKGQCWCESKQNACE